MKYALLLLSIFPACSSTSAKDEMILAGESVDIRAEIQVDGKGIEATETMVRGKDGRVTAQFHLRNLRSQSVRVRVSWAWKDADGMALRAATGGKGFRTLLLRPDQPETITLLSPTQTAVEALIHVQALDTSS